MASVAGHWWPNWSPSLLLVSFFLDLCIERQGHQRVSSGCPGVRTSEPSPPRPTGVIGHQLIVDKQQNGRLQCSVYMATVAAVAVAAIDNDYYDEDRNGNGWKYETSHIMYADNNSSSTSNASDNDENSNQADDSDNDGCFET